jgi:hypothetical protein
MFEKLELNVETLRELTEDQLSLVAGGAVSGLPCNTSDYVPSGSAWTANCETIYRTTTLTDNINTG